VDAACDRYLVLAACHNYSAASSVMRLLHVGVEPYLVSQALNGALSQRLARRVCPDCKTMQPAPPGFDLDSIPIGAGCEACSSVGLRGQIGVHELLLNSPPVRDCICQNPTREQLMQTACDHGMIRLRDDGLKKVAAGWVSLEEMLRVTRD
jgi:general secretion pathway protein E